MQFPYLCDRQRQGDEVDRNTVSSMGERQCVVVYAFPGVLSIPLRPCKTDGRADEGSCKSERYYRRELEVDDGPYNFPKSFVRKDLQKEEQKGDFDETERGEVRNLANPEILHRDMS